MKGIRVRSPLYCDECRGLATLNPFECGMERSLIALGSRIKGWSI
ncbi:MAG: hypothetical protein V7L27_12945 [Nostoc sp.]